MKKILCFGDSNTYGFNPENMKRYNKNERWSGILADKYDLVECGCNNRSIFNNFGELNSLEVLPKYLQDNFTYIILQVGINDLQFHYNINLEMFEDSLNKLLELIDKKLKIFLLCPNELNGCVLNSYFVQFFDEISIEKSKMLPEIYKRVADKFGCNLINLNDFTNVSRIDGLHYDVENHKLIANYMLNLLN